jgi:putative endonuclease
MALAFASLRSARKASLRSLYGGPMSQAPDPRLRVGRLGERLAARKLERAGFTVIERNYRTREGELDIVARRQPVLVFCEVKTIVARGSGRGPAYALEAVGNAKRAQVRRIARSWMSEHASLARGCPNVRFDAVGVTLSPAGEVLSLEHVENAF